MFIFLMGMTYCKQCCGSLGLEILQEISLMCNKYSMEKVQNIIKFEKYFESCLQFHAKWHNCDANKNQRKRLVS